VSCEHSFCPEESGEAHETRRGQCITIADLGGTAKVTDGGGE
jgi:hypothetical protein